MLEGTGKKSKYACPLRCLSHLHCAQAHTCHGRKCREVLRGTFFPKPILFWITEEIVSLPRGRFAAGRLFDSGLLAMTPYSGVNTSSTRAVCTVAFGKMQPRVTPFDPSAPTAT